MPTSKLEQPRSERQNLQRQGIDPRGPRFGAAVTTAVLAAVVLLGPGSGFGALLLAIQVVAFAAGAVLGLQSQPYGWLFRRFVRPLLGAPAELEDPAPPRFAQAVGLVFAVLGALGWLLNSAPLFFVSLGFALAAAFLNAVFGYCLGCEVYLLGRRVSSRTPRNLFQRKQSGSSVAGPNTTIGRN